VAKSSALSGVDVRLNPLYIVAVAVLSVLYVWTLYNIPVLVVGVKDLRLSTRKKKERSSLGREELPTVSIVVPVKDEEKVVGRLLKSLLKLDYPPERREVIVVEDGSVDNTAKICAEYADQYPKEIRLIRQSASTGKPPALNCALKHAQGEIVAVLDADNVPEPDMLLRAVEYFKEPSLAALQGRACAINAEENMLTKFVSYEEAVRYETYLRGKDALNLFVPITGSCYFIRRNVLLDVGGWDNECLSEDMEMALRLTKRGYRIRYAPEVRSWQENPVSLIQLIRQRTRWFRGDMEMALKYGKLMTKPDRRNVDAEMTLIGPFLFILCLMSYFLGPLTFLSPFQSETVFVIVTQVTSAITLVPLFIIGFALMYVTKPWRVANLLWLPFIYAYWSLQTLLASFALLQIAFRQPKKWTKTVKTGKAANRDFTERVPSCGLKRG